MSKHCHALLIVPPIYRDVMENARGSIKHHSLRVVELASRLVIMLFCNEQPQKAEKLLQQLIRFSVMPSTTGAPKLINSDLFLEKHATVLQYCSTFFQKQITINKFSVARFSRNKSLLISFGAPVLLLTENSLPVKLDIAIDIVPDEPNA